MDFFRDHLHFHAEGLTTSELHSVLASCESLYTSERYFRQDHLPGMISKPPGAWLSFQQATSARA